MKNNLEKLDKQFHDKFSNYELPVSDNVLTNIKKELNLQSSSKGISRWVWVLSGLLILTTISGMYYYVTDNAGKTNIKAVAKAKVEAVKTADANQLAMNNVNHSITKKKVRSRNGNNGMSVNSQALPSAINENENNQEENETTVKSMDAATTNNAVAKDNSIATVTNVNADAKKKDIEGVDKTNRARTLATQNKKKTNANASIASEKKTVAQTKEDAEDFQMNVVELTHKMTVNKKKETVKASSTESKKENKTTAKQKENLYASAAAEKQIPETNNGMRQLMNKEKADLIRDSITAWKADSAKVASSLSAAVKQVEVIPIDEPIAMNKEKKMNYFIELNGGPVFAKSTIGTSSSFDNLKGVTTYTAGLDFGVIYKNKFSINTGIGIDNKGEKYSQSINTGKYVTTYFTHDSLGTTVIDSSFINYRIIKNSASVKNNYTYLKVPIMIGYCFTFKDKLFVKPSVGVTINYLMVANATWLDSSSGEFVSYSKSDNVFNSINLAGRFKIDVGYTIKNKYYFSIQPGYTQYFQSAYSKSINGSSIDLKPYSFDITFGIGYKF